MSSEIIGLNIIYFYQDSSNMKFKGGERLILDYSAIGKRISLRRKKLKMTQAQVSELADISVTYMSGIERAVSIPSTEVIMRLAIALDTTPDEFLVGTAVCQDNAWKNVADQLRSLSRKQLHLVSSFIDWIRNEEL